MRLRLARPWEQSNCWRVNWARTNPLYVYHMLLRYLYRVGQYSCIFADLSCYGPLVSPGECQCAVEVWPAHLPIDVHIPGHTFQPTASYFRCETQAMVM